MELRDAVQHAAQLVRRVQDGGAEVEGARPLPERAARHHAHACRHHAPIHKHPADISIVQLNTKHIKCAACLQYEIEQKVHLRWTANERAAKIRR